MLIEIPEELFDKIIETLEFYENPPTRDKNNQPTQVPDFYDEYSFGDKASECLEDIRHRGYIV